MSITTLADEYWNSPAWKTESERMDWISSNSKDIAHDAKSLPVSVQELFLSFGGAPVGITKKGKPVRILSRKPQSLEGFSRHQLEIILDQAQNLHRGIASDGAGTFGALPLTSLVPEPESRLWTKFGKPLVTYVLLPMSLIGLVFAAGCTSKPNDDKKPAPDNSSGKIYLNGATITSYDDASAEQPFITYLKAYSIKNASRDSIPFSMTFANRTLNDKLSNSGLVNKLYTYSPTTDARCLYENNKVSGNTSSAKNLNFGNGAIEFGINGALSHDMNIIVYSSQAAHEKNGIWENGTWFEAHCPNLKDESTAATWTLTDSGGSIVKQGSDGINTARNGEFVSKLPALNKGKDYTLKVVLQNHPEVYFKILINSDKNIDQI